MVKGEKEAGGATQMRYIVRTCEWNDYPYENSWFSGAEDRFRYFCVVHVSFYLFTKMYAALNTIAVCFCTLYTRYTLWYIC